jgi:hypothetical protein
LASKLELPELRPAREGLATNMRSPGQRRPDHETDREARGGCSVEEPTDIPGMGRLWCNRPDRRKMMLNPVGNGGLTRRHRKRGHREILVNCWDTLGRRSHHCLEQCDKLTKLLIRLGVEGFNQRGAAGSFKVTLSEEQAVIPALECLPESWIDSQSENRQNYHPAGEVVQIRMFKNFLPLTQRRCFPQLWSMTTLTRVRMMKWSLP